MIGVSQYITESLNQVYQAIGGLGITYYYVPYISKGYRNNRDLIDYDFKGKIKIPATINSIETGDVDLEHGKLYLKTTRECVNIQFTLDSIAPHKVRPLDRIYVEYDDGRFENYLIVGVDGHVLLQGICTSLRAFRFDGTLTKFQWLENGVPVSGN